MHQTTKRLIGTTATSLLILTSIVTPASASGSWKSLRSDDGDRIHWKSCTVEYAVDMNDYSPSRRKALNEAIRSTEAASGVDFVRVPWSRADLKITLSHRRHGKVIASTQSYMRGDEYTHSKVIVYSKAFRYSYSDQVDNYRHEFGHVLGLDHVKGSDIMSAYVTSHPTRSGWRTGLGWLYRGC